MTDKQLADQIKATEVAIEETIKHMNNLERLMLEQQKLLHEMFIATTEYARNVAVMLTEEWDKQNIPPEYPN